MKLRLISFLLITTLYSHSLLAEVITELFIPSHKTATELLKPLRILFNNQAIIAAESGQIILKGKQQVVNAMLELLLQLDHSPKKFTVSISNTPINELQNYRQTLTRQLYINHFVVSENQPLQLSQKRVSPQLVSHNLHWLQNKNKTISEQQLSIQVQSATEQVYIDFAINTLRNGQQESINGHVNGPLGQWLQLTNAPQGVIREQNTDLRKWSTQSRKVQNIAIKVTLLD